MDDGLLDGSKYDIVCFERITGTATPLNVLTDEAKGSDDGIIFSSAMGSWSISMSLLLSMFPNLSREMRSDSFSELFLITAVRRRRGRGPASASDAAFVGNGAGFADRPGQAMLTGVNQSHFWQLTCGPTNTGGLDGLCLCHGDQTKVALSDDSICHSATIHL